MRFGTQNVRSLYRSGSLTTVARETARHKLDSMGVQVRWDKGGTLRLYFFLQKGNKNHQSGTGCFGRHIIVSAVKRIEIISDRMSYITLRGHWCNIIVLNVHT